MNPRLAWSLAGIAAAVAVVFLVYGTHTLTIIQRVALRVF
jgi:hypothetical protein